MRNLAAAIFVSLLSSTWAWASYWDGSALLAGCKPAQDGSYAGGMCLGYIMGVADLQNNSSAAGATGKPYCMPEGDDADTAEELREVVLKYLMSRPDSLQQSASNLVEQAFTQNFPCASSANP
jgi:hypothetical protein